MSAVPMVGRSAQNPGKMLLGLTPINVIANKTKPTTEIICEFSLTNFLKKVFSEVCDISIATKYPIRNSQKREKGKKNAALGAVKLSQILSENEAKKST